MRRGLEREEGGRSTIPFHSEPSRDCQKKGSEDTVIRPAARDTPITEEAVQQGVGGDRGLFLPTPTCAAKGDYLDGDGIWRVLAL